MGHYVTAGTVTLHPLTKRYSAVGDGSQRHGFPYLADAETSQYVKKMLSLMEYDVPYTSNEIMAFLGLKSKENLRKNYLNPAIGLGLVRMTIPDKPNSRNQRYVRI